jgi:hypothetical protein
MVARALINIQWLKTVNAHMRRMQMMQLSSIPTCTGPQTYHGSDQKLQQQRLLLPSSLSFLHSSTQSVTAVLPLLPLIAILVSLLLPLLLLVLPASSVPCTAPCATSNAPPGRPCSSTCSVEAAAGGYTYTGT